ncbi:MAG TPA: hypothetical protein VHN80_07895, partial [Kineosporiaceae bacterium]|nr:hypothetical protein [Kineosporiaceae bacterium]
MPRAVLPRLVAVLVAAAGLVLLVVGVSRAGSSAAATDIVGRLPKVGQQVVVTAPGMTELAGSTLRVQASAADPARPVFIGVGRADDVEAYVGSSGRVETTALDSAGVLRVSVRGNGSLPDPASVDVWAAAVRSQGAATLTWPRTPGAWRLVVTTDGTAPPAAVQFTWSGSSGSSPAPALIAVGLV